MAGCPFRLFRKLVFGLIRLIDRLQDDLGDILQLDGAIGGLAGVGQHDHAERAGDCQGGDTGGLDLGEAVSADTLLPVLFFFPHLSAARAAAERAHAMARQFDQLGPGAAQCLARVVQDMVVAAQVTRVVVGEPFLASLASA